MSSSAASLQYPKIAVCVPKGWMALCQRRHLQSRKWLLFMSGCVRLRPLSRSMHCVKNATNSESRLRSLESAAVGLSARGLAHELRAHLSDIRYRLHQISKAAEHGNESASVIQAHVKAIRSSCSAIMSAASLIDPMLL